LQQQQRRTAPSLVFLALATSLRAATNAELLLADLTTTLVDDGLILRRRFLRMIWRNAFSLRFESPASTCREQRIVQGSLAKMIYCEKATLV
jgi:hypothetical protein